jgi:hypothetical protein
MLQLRGFVPTVDKVGQITLVQQVQRGTPPGLLIPGCCLQVKVVEFHPVQPWIAFADKGDVVKVWDWSTQQVRSRAPRARRTARWSPGRFICVAQRRRPCRRRPRVRFGWRLGSAPGVCARAGAPRGATVRRLGTPLRAARLASADGRCSMT